MIHILFMGGTLCGTYWPSMQITAPQDKWVSVEDTEHADCGECLAVFKKEKSRLLVTKRKGVA